MSLFRIFFIIAFSAVSLGAAAQPCLSGYSYRRALTVDNTANPTTLNSHQVLLTLNTQTLITNGKLNPSGFDLRVTDAGGGSLDYFIEPATLNTANTRIWVKAPVLASASSTTFYLFYGNSNAVNASSGDNTFDLFDDFTGTSINGSKWNTCGSGNYTVSGGEVTLASNGSAGGNALLESNTDFNYPVFVEGKVNSAGTGKSLFGLYDNARNGYGLVYETIAGSPVYVMKSLNDDAAACFSLNNLTAPNNTTRSGSVVQGLWSFNWAGTGSQGFRIPGIAGTQNRNDGSVTFSTPLKVALGNLTDNSSIAVDYVWVRKHTANQPTVSAGAEQELVSNLTAGSNGPVCEGSDLDLTTTFYPGATYNWSGPGGFTSNAQNPSRPNAAPSASGTYSVTVDNGSGCASQVASVNAVVNPTTVGGTVSGGSTVCAGNNNGTLTLGSHTGDVIRWESSSSAGGPWNTINNTSATLNYNNITATTYYRAVVKSGACAPQNSSVEVVNVSGPVNAGQITGSAAVCEVQNNGTLTLSGNTGNVVKWQTSTDNATWTDISNTTNTLNYSGLTQTTYYRVEVEAAPCASVFSSAAVITVNPQPDVSFTENNACRGTATEFVNTTTLASGTQNQFNWIFGDGNGSNNENPTHTYANEGTYTVILQVTSSEGCTGADTQTVEVRPAPNVNWTAVDICEQTAQTFTNNTSVSGGASVASYTWDFDDATSSGATNPVKTFLNPGTFNVKLTAVTNQGCADSLTKAVEIHPRAQVAFTASQACAGETVSFSNNTGVAGGTATYTWDFDDGNASSAVNPTHTFNAPGTYQVKLIAETDKGCFDSTTVAVTVTPQPTADFNFADVCHNTPVSFTDVSSTGGGTLTYNWDFGDGNNSAQASPQHLYSQPGTYTVTLQITETGGCTSTVSKSVNVRPNPVSNFSFGTTCAGNTLNFSNQSSVSSGTLTYEWDFDDGTFSTAANPNKIFSVADTYRVRLVSESGFGCTDTLIQPVIIAPNTAAGTLNGATSVCSGSNQDSLTITGKTGDVVRWEYSTTGGSPWTTVNQTTDFLVFQNLTQTTYYRALVKSGGCDSAYTNTAQIEVNPISDGGTAQGAQTVCEGTNSGQLSLTGYTGNIVDWISQPAAGGAFVSLGTSSPAPSYSNLTQSTLFRAVVQSGVCAPDTSAPVEITVSPATVSGTLTGTDTVCAGANNGVLTINGRTGDVIRWESSTTGGSPWTTINNVSGNLSYNNLNQTTAYRALVQSGACNPIYTNTVSITVDGITAAGNVTGSSTVCESENNGFVTLNSYSGDIQKWQFSTDGLNWNDIANTSPAQNYTNLDTTTWYRAFVQSGVCGLQISDSAKITVNPLPVPDFSNTTACLGTTTDFTNQTTISPGNLNNAGYSWDFGNGAGSTSVNPSHNFAAAGNYSVTLRVTTAAGCVDSVTRTVAVNRLPQVNFNTQDVCFPNPAAFNNLSFVAGAGSIANYTWNFDNGNFSNAANPTEAYSAPGTYQVKLIAETTQGCADSASQSLIIKPKPAASFTADSTCLGTQVNFVNSSSIPAGNLNYFWRFGNGQNDTLQTPAYSYPAQGTYTVVLEVNSNEGCSDTASQAVEVYDQPQADFAFNDICLNDTAAFQNQTANAGTAPVYQWQFGDGNTAGGANSQHVYNAEGSFNVNLQVTTAQGCTDDESKFIQVHPNPVTSFQAADACLGNQVNFQNQTSLTAGSASYDWGFGDGNQSAQNNPQHLYAAPGVYGVSLLATSGFGCVDSTFDTVEVFDQTTAGTILGTDSVCVTSNTGVVQLNGNVGSPLYWESSLTGGAPWTTVNSINDSISYNQLTATTWYRAVVQNGVCGRDTSAPAEINVSPASAGGLLTGGDTVCAANNAGNLVLNNNTGAVTNWLVSNDTAQTWSNYSGSGNTNTFNSLTQNSHFAVRVKSGVCEADTSNAVFVQVDSTSLAGTLLGADTVCATQNGGFVEVNGLRGNVQKWERRNHPSQPWVSVLNNADSLQYQNLTDTTFYRAEVKNGTCPSVLTNTIQIRVDEATQAGTVLGSNTYCEDVNAGFVNLNGNNGVINRWQFSVDGGPWQDSAFTAQNLNFQSLDTTTLYRAVVQNGVCAERFSDSAVITIHPKPDVDFATNTACLNDTTFFTNQTTITSGSTQSWNWDFDNGSSASTQNPTHVFSNPGAYQVQLVVASNRGCVDSLTQQVDVNPLPQVNFSQNDICLLDSMGFNNGSSIPAGTIAQYIWNFGDGDTSHAANPFHSYLTHGTYNVQLYAEAATGCADSTQQSVQVHPHPAASWQADTVFEPAATTFQNNTSIVNGAQLTYNWQFGDGNSSPSVNPVYAYAQYGTYNALLIAESTFGCADTLSQPVLVQEQPEAVFATNDECIHDSMVFNNQSQYASGTANYVWDFGDGDTSHAVSPSHIYDFPGNYTVNLQLEADNGGTDSYTMNVNVYAKPAVAFAFEDVCDTLPVKFRNQSTISNGSMTYEWFYGDGDTAQAVSPRYVYPTSGYFDAKLRATSNFGCRDSAIQEVHVLSRPRSQFSVQDVCYGDTSVFVDSTTIDNGYLVSYNWTFGDATNSNSVLQSPSYLYLNPGEYYVTLKTESNEGCLSIFTDTAVVYETPVAAFNHNDVCLNEAVQFQNNSFYASGTPFYDWQFDDGNMSSARNPEYTYRDSGFYDVTLTVTSPEQCYDQVTHTVEIFPLPVPEAVAQEPTVSKGFSTQLAATGGVSYLWSPAASLNRADVQTPVATPLQTTNYNVVAVDSNGCVNDTSVTVEVDADYKIIATNVITPDGNGINDRWKIENIGTYGDCSISIYNRWGQKVYSEDGYNNTWEGTNQAGEPLPDATYYYVIWFEGSDREYKGAVTVLRNER